MKLPLPEEIPACDALGSVHFVGIGGAGLSGIARIMLARGVTVSGSDAADSGTLAALRARGATVWVGHAADQVTDVDVVVVSTAIPDSNPEVVAALAAGITVWPRSAALVSVLRGKRTIAVAGTHGKTTTTSLLTSGLLAAGWEPAYAIGADLTATGSNAEDGAGEWFVAEADESDGAFLAYHPEGAIVTNVEADHLDHWGSAEAYQQGFGDFVDTVGRWLVLVAEDAGARRLVEPARARGLEVLTVGLDDNPGAALHAQLVGHDVVLTAEGSRCAVALDGVPWGELRLQIPGRHYLLDALAALGAAHLAGAPFAEVASGMAQFRGAKRRMEFKGEGRGVRVYDSYAHHPQEISADLAAAQSLRGDGRLVVAFQPHLVSRTRVFGAEMGRALSAADLVVVLDIYVARESADPEVTADVVSDAVAGVPVFRVAGVSEAASLLADVSRPGDVILTLGAGSVTEVGPTLLAELTA